MKNRILLLCLIFGCIQSSSAIQKAEAEPEPDAKKLAETEVSAEIPDLKKMNRQQLVAAINETGEAINSIIRDFQETTKVIASASLNTEYTSEEVEKKREEVKNAQIALLIAQQELQKAVAELPELKQLSLENEARQAKIAALRQRKLTLSEALAKLSRTSE
jgi:Flp pilus assembly protein TadD